jgi:hypothetical protein
MFAGRCIDAQLLIADRPQLLIIRGYVVWRRTRNRRLTGSPTTYPNR